ncbi:COQ9 family protein [Novosphingobium mangrovi (ex Hu et al. 2023)]|uniref:COQ9 family protein n=1 Tax=Novosphingobium mangrovi (ex Hu et al. 2023) TaxID=2930094 RepID=A0ABT0AI28_9SPHN|nr:COQ9 family protein [Novosphingobium mangrovi (ex Hu et al. 2023)]MCJ1962837.1 COQ9 family protein [Novosphingobium mangrovi (ex Hu et al. 2023)]
MEEATTLADLRRNLAPAIADAAAFDGWSAQAVEQAARQHGVDPELAAYAFGGKQMAMIEAWIEAIDAGMFAAVPADSLAGVPVREKIRRLVMARLEAASGREEALTRALAIMAMPQNLARAAQLGWYSADLMWRVAGDTATDYNHYTKRTTLGALYAATLQVYAREKDPEKPETRAFLERRIEGILRFEKVKAQLTRSPDERFSLTRLLGRLRYPAR